MPTIEAEKPVTNPPNSGVDEKGRKYLEQTIEGAVYRVRRIKVKESNEAYDMAYNEEKQTFNSRLNTSLLLTHTVTVDGKSIGPDDIEEWDSWTQAAVLRLYDKINILPPADAQGNA